MFTKKITLILYAILFVGAVLFPQIEKDDYILHTAILSTIFVLLTMGLNLLVGFTGQLSLGHAAFFGVGAYVSAILTVTYGFNFWTAIFVAAIVSGAFGLCLGFPALKLKGPYLVMSTIGFVHIMHELFLNWYSVTRGAMGIVGIKFPPPIRLGSWSIDFSIPQNYFYLTLFWAVLGFIFLYTVIHSKIGRALMAIRENDIAAECLGINLTRYKLFAFCTGALFAGIAGSLYAHYISYISPDSFTLAESINILVMVIFGGMGTLMGPVIGAVAVTFLLENLRFLQEYRLIIYGILLMLIIIFAPGGLMGFIMKYVSARNSSKADLPQEGA
ncbi:MAG: branched-chain amino acid ABC transporter permease [Synergistaceae bacterium]|nr:branched-chain amino acid ABC transporter permease [Synergistaceae bacterium]